MLLLIIFFQTLEEGSDSKESDLDVSGKLVSVTIGGDGMNLYFLFKEVCWWGHITIIPQIYEILP